jgi:hypothetical protein
MMLALIDAFDRADVDDEVALADALGRPFN